MCVRRRAGRLRGMTSGRGTLTALHLLLVWATMTAAMPVLGFELVVTAWGGGAGAAVPVLALGVPLMVGLLAIAGIPARTVVPLCGSVRRMDRLGCRGLRPRHARRPGGPGRLRRGRGPGECLHPGRADGGAVRRRRGVLRAKPVGTARGGGSAGGRMWSTGAPSARCRHSSADTRRRSRATGSIRN